MKSRTIVAALCVFVLVQAASAAAPLADRLPAKTLAYAGWAGKTAAFDRSMLGQLTREPVADAIVKAIQQAAEENIRDKKELQAFRNVWEMISVGWKHPIAVALVDFQPPQDKPPVVSGAILIDLGKDRAKFAKHLDALLELAKKDVPTAEAELPGGLKYRKLLIKDEEAPPMALGYMGNVFFLGIGADMPAALAAVTPDKSLQAAASFKTHYGQVDGDDVLEAFYVDVAAILKRVEPMLPRPRQKPKPPGPAAEEPAAPVRRGPAPRKIMEAMGVDKVQALAGSARVVDQRLYSKVKLFTPAPHQGVLLLLAGGKLTDAEIAAVPADATFFGAVKLSPQAVFDQIRRAIRIVDPAEEEDFLEGLKEFEDMFGASITKDILPALGDTWVLSSAPSQGGFLTGTVLTVGLKDSKKLASALEKIEAALRKQMTPLAPAAPTPSEPGEPAPPKPRREQGPTIESVKIDGLNIRYVRLAGMPVPVAPAWTIHKGKLYIAAWPQVLATAIQNEGTRPITKDAGFRALRRHAARRPSILAYCNTPQVLRQLYGLGLLGWTAGANMLAGKTGVAVKPDWLPVLSKLEKYLSASIGSVSADKDGITLESYEAMPSLMTAVPAAAAMVWVRHRDVPVEGPRPKPGVERAPPKSKEPDKEDF